MMQRRTTRVLGVAIDVIAWKDAVAVLNEWARAHASRVVCICNAHSVVTARRDPAFAAVLEGADMCTPDGAPVAWMLRRLGASRQQRISGPDLMWRFCAQAAEHGHSIYLYGGAQATLDRLHRRLSTAFPDLLIAGAISPPFRATTPTEDDAAVAAINASGAGVVWVGLGCPKQELWMANNSGRIRAAMVGVGAAFDFHAGTVRRAPEWMQQFGLEWLHRLASEPRRLWRRYLVTNALFLWGAARQLIRI